MKKIIIIFTTIFLCLQLGAQQARTYLITKGGKEFTSAQWTETYLESAAIIEVNTKNVQRTVTTCDLGGKTLKWHFTSNDGKNDYTVTRSGDTYTLAGKLDGKANVEKTMEGDGLPWYQLANYSAGKITFPKNMPVTYECIRPTNGKLTTMSLTIVGEEDFGGHHCKVVKASTAGVIAGLWSCLYFIDVKTGQYIGYKGVEGFIGTPETQWILQ